MDLGSLRTILKKLLTVLDDGEPMVITCRCGLDGREKVSYVELRKRIGLTRERTRQIEWEALEVLQSCMDSAQLINNIDFELTPTTKIIYNKNTNTGMSKG